MSAQNKFFSASLLLAAVTASDHINTAFHDLHREHEPVAHRRHFNLEAALNQAHKPQNGEYQEENSAYFSSENEIESDGEEEPTNYFFEYPVLHHEDEHHDDQVADSVDAHDDDHDDVIHVEPDTMHSVPHFAEHHYVSEHGDEDSEDFHHE